MLTTLLYVQCWAVASDGKENSLCSQSRQRSRRIVAFMAKNSVHIATEMPVAFVEESSSFSSAVSSRAIGDREMKRLVRCRKPMFTPGEHDAKLVAIETVPSPWNRGKDSLEFRFEGEACEISKITGVVLRIGESLHSVAEQLVGASIRCGEEVDLDAFIGRKYRIEVAGGQTGGVAVERIIPTAE